ncbi:MAG: dockerin type I repeat-containing protein [Ruminococcus sp.]|nr:dockerin type I repeat-containing protein [Ruminococcus sp.]
MKKLLSTLLSISVIAGAVPIGAGAKADPIFIESGEDHWEYTSIRGDVNADGKISVSDVVVLQKWIMGIYDDESDTAHKETVDVNFDGYVDSFDLVQMRQLVLNPESAEVHKYAVDVLNTDAEIPAYEEVVARWEDGNFNHIITEYDEMSAYLKTFITNSDELQKYLEKYDETFFEENNLILAPYIQERGNGVLTEAGFTTRIIKDEKINKGIFFVINGNYNENEGLYPVTNTKMLAQITIPKSQSSAEDNILYIDSAHFIFGGTPDSCQYTDGNHELVLVNQGGMHHTFTDVYLRNPDGSLTYIEDMFDLDFENNGELSGENYNISFLDEGFVIDYKLGDSQYKIQSTYDGENVLEFTPYNTAVYKSPDGETELYFNSEYSYRNEDGTRIDMYIKQPDGYLKWFNLVSTYGNNMPFKQDGEWSVDSDGNNVFSGDTYSITWLDNSIIVDYHYDGNWWATCERNFDNPSTERTFYRK